MGLLFRFLRLSHREQKLLVQATLLLAVVRIGLRTLPFATLRRILSKLASSRGRHGNSTSVDIVGREIIWAVGTVGRHITFIGTCLTQALATYVLLARRGVQSDLRIGVTRDSSGKFVAHAWLENDSALLIGGDCSKDYTPMPALKGLEP